MRILVIPDIHLKSWLFDRAEAILKKGKADISVCLMDIPDDWDMAFQIGRYQEVFDRAAAFAAAFPDTRWCYGNHDISYLWGKLESGYSPYAERTVISGLRELESTLNDRTKLAFIHRIGKVLFSHGGLSAAFVRCLGKELPDAGIDDVTAAVNHAGEALLWDDESPLWLRPQYRNVKGFRKDDYTQVVGHTPVEAVFEKGGFISTDVFSTYPGGKQIGESVMIVIDSESGKFEKLAVEGEFSA